MIKSSLIEQAITRFFGSCLTWGGQAASVFDFIMSFFLRHLLWTTVCPGTVTIILPWFLLSSNRIGADPATGWMQWISILLIATGVTILISCILSFARFGKGTLSPFDPARHLVIKGFYRYVRNPMYVAVIIILCGEALLFSSNTILIYTLIMFVLFNVFIIFYEEPYLRKQFGEPYDRYREKVDRWIPGKPYH